jgi:hypothetical protein
MSLLVLAGCASVGESQQVASRECKVYPLEPTKSLASARSRPSELDQRWAVGALGTSDLRFRELNKPFGMNGLVEESLRDCNS